MRNIWTIAKREFNLYFISPIAYVVAFMILLIVGLIFYVNILAATVQQYAPGVTIILGPLVTLLLFTTPAITMRTLAEEQKMGTLEILLTSPVRDWELIIGKWLGGFLFILTIMVVTLIFPIILNFLIKPGIDRGILISGYLGILLLAGCFLAVGIAVSSFFSNQIAAFFVTIGVLLLFWMISYPSQAVGGNGIPILNFLDLSQHYYNSFYVGLIQLKDIVYYVTFTAFALFIGTLSIDARRWK
jgi:ABC-2 type transport system permease protein